ncbi:MurR/RpiR family transcriptional regulator [Bacillus sp. CMF21]|uniref:MurR/RpiR family transcriptional regulator n=1 Tax=Metabacillus dongyingensis TaxID=2874282 RepID=UPI001CBE31D3|nr:MurR/RpiR family transcriptional regulator [Metabacillus dongyingensis]UAL51487.1 MurR/RpiR family transcriptional regulator [Metabacillus dongyingensis]UOK57394.1 MurR/RpiR family transcriptional regulator [Bacillus sp. OVS6]USK27789.1 MurR/RpiR family transcriptional regulator [Bacillus sp. CMF21]
MKTFLKRLSQRRDQLSQLEKQVLDYILINPNFVVQSNVNDLAKELFVSTATISRTCKQLGYEGFQDLKYTLSKYVDHDKDDENIISSNTILTQIDRVKKEMEQTLQNLNEEKIQKAAAYIKESNYVEFFGVGASLPTCVEAARKLTFSGRICSAREDWDELRCVANSLSENDLAILVSYSGETLHILEFANILKEKNVKTIAVVGRRNSRLEQEVDLTFHAHITNGYYGELDMSSRFPLSIILDFIILTYMNH